jgi:enamine deaminase RidA (YjgF/YER057c/UK114 family)
LDGFSNSRCSTNLYNALYESDLRIDHALVESGRATIYLSGTLGLDGACDKPRIEAQIRQTAEQFSTVNESVVYINGTLLEHIQ